MKPKISVIIPVYNVEKYVAECVNSVLSQTYDNIEILIIDDCSPDNSINIIKEIAANYYGGKEIKIVSHKTNQGLSAARNTGIRNAIGDFIYFIDSDDWLAYDKAIEDLVNAQVSTGAVAVTANRTMIDDVTGKTHNIDVYGDTYIESDDLVDMDYLSRGAAWNLLINRDFIIEHKLYFDEGIVWEDVVWVFKINCVSPSIATISSKTYNYRWFREGSIMNTLEEKHILSAILIPYYADKYIKLNTTKKSIYAAKAIEDFVFGALCRIDKHTRDISLFREVYYGYRHHLHSNIAPYIKHFKLSTKIRTFHHKLPSWLGMYYEYLLVISYRGKKDNTLILQKDRISNIRMKIKNIIINNG